MCDGIFLLTKNCRYIKKKDRGEICYSVLIIILKLLQIFLIHQVSLWSRFRYRGQ